MKRYEGSKLDIISRSWWIYFFATEWNSVGVCGTSYGINATEVTDFYFPDNEFLDHCVLTAVEITIPR